MAALLLFLTGVLATFTASAGTGTFQDEFHRTYALVTGGRVSLENLRGNVRILGWDCNRVRVDAVARSYSPERLEDAKVLVEETPGAVHIHTSYPAEDDSEHPSSVDYTVMVPRAARLDQVKLMSGTLEISGVRGAVRASSVSGAIHTRNLAGDVRLTTVSGSLEAIFDELGAGRSIYMNSVNGPIEVLLPINAHADFRADTVSGGIRNEYGAGGRERAPGRHWNTSLKGGGTRIRVSNVDGSISLAAVWHGHRVKFT